MVANEHLEAVSYISLSIYIWPLQDLVSLETSVLKHNDCGCSRGVYVYTFDWRIKMDGGLRQV